VVGEVRLGEPELLGLRVHTLDERFLLAVGEVLGHGGGGVVGGGDADPVEEDPQRHLLVGAEPHPVLGRRPRAPTDRDQVVPLGPSLLDVLEREVERHHLGEARRRVGLVGVLLVQHLAVGIQEQDALRAHL